MRERCTRAVAQQARAQWVDVLGHVVIVHRVFAGAERVELGFLSHGRHTIRPVQIETVGRLA